MNVGRISGGNRPNAVPAEARALLDIRFPPGMTAWEIHGLVTTALEGHPMVACQLLDHADPTWTNPEHELAGLVRKNAAEILGHPPAATIRAGFSDARSIGNVAFPASVMASRHITAARRTNMWRSRICGRFARCIR